jgi:hypothetical protein
MNDNQSANVHYSLNNLENYLKTINESASDIINKYYMLISEYLNFIVENIKFKNLNTNYTKFIIKRGFETITHVFTMLLYLSRNLNIAYYHSQKAFYFYVEFIGQISDDKHTFLQLSSRDASIFVYKKTIFEVNNEIRKNITDLSDNDTVKLDFLNIYVTIMQKITYFILEKDYNYLKQIQPNQFEITNNNLSYDDIHIIDNFINNFNYIKNNISFNKCFELTQSFINKYVKSKNGQGNKTILNESIINKFGDQLIEEKINEPTVIFIKWIFS